MHGAKADACGRSFAVLSTQISTAGLGLWQKTRRGAQGDARGAMQVLDRGE
jgi:hypothetical protein